MNLDAEHVALLAGAVPWAAATWRSRRVSRRIAVAIWTGCALGVAAALGDAAAAATATSTSLDANRTAVGAAIGATLGAAFAVLSWTPNSRRRDSPATVVLAVAVAGAILCALGFRRGHGTGVTLGVATVLLSAGAAIAHGRYSKATPFDQRSARWVGVAGLGVLSVAPVMVGLSALGIEAPWRWLAIAAVGVGGLGFLASTIPALHGTVDTTMRITSAIASASVLVGAVALVIAIVNERGLDASERRAALLAIALSVVAAFAWPSVFHSVYAAVRRVALGSRPSPSETVARFTSRLTRAVPLLELFTQMCESLRSSMQLQSAEVWRLANGTLSVIAGAPKAAASRADVDFDDRAAAALLNTRVSGGTWVDVWLPALVAGRSSANVRIAPLLNGGEVLGVLVCERSPAGDAFTASFDADLSELARNVALALRNLRLDAALQASQVELEARNDQLVESRARLVAAGDEQRRRIERDLHDGAQQQLVSIALKLRLARDVLHDSAENPANDTGDASALLGEISTDVDSAIVELRNLAHGIFPPVLMSGGLRPALAAAATRSPLPVSIDVASDVGRHAPDLEAAVYFCCVEALQNAAKHAGAATEIEVRLWRERNELFFEVADNGRGFEPAAARAGHGFTNMRDRLGARAGRIEITSSLGAGTRVVGRVPTVS